ncbi:MAG: AbrB/MazE/SpoVT family DNA-binding domain-containing protein [Candidatus Acidiferrales bacterium]
MTAKKQARITSRGQITVPHEIRRALGVRPAVTSFFAGGRAQYDGIDSGVTTLFDYPLYFALRGVVLDGDLVQKLVDVLADAARTLRLSFSGTPLKGASSISALLGVQSQQIQENRVDVTIAAHELQIYSVN